MGDFFLVENAAPVPQVFHLPATGANNEIFSMSAREAGHGQLHPTRIHSRGAGSILLGPTTVIRDKRDHREKIPIDSRADY